MISNRSPRGEIRAELETMSQVNKADVGKAREVRKMEGNTGRGGHIELQGRNADID